MKYLILLFLLMSCKGDVLSCQLLGVVKKVHSCSEGWCRVDLEDGKRMDVSSLAAPGDEIYILYRNGKVLNRNRTVRKLYCDRWGSKK